MTRLTGLVGKRRAELVGRLLSAHLYPNCQCQARRLYMVLARLESLVLNLACWLVIAFPCLLFVGCYKHTERFFVFMLHLSLS